MERSTNALAELAETLKHHIEPRRLNADKDEFAVAICKAHRIVAELAKVDGMERISFECLASMLSECRDIAEEGAENEKND